MRRALMLARRGLGRVHPNPMVGAVLVRQGRVLAEGYHARFGGPHAEVAALKGVGRVPRDAELYVNLEPCAHYGKTPPCVELLIRKGVRRVVMGWRDPNPCVRGRGERRLRQAGVKVTGGVLEEECRKLNRDYAHWVRFHRPYVVVKAAQTLDGKIAVSGRAAGWITGPEARRYGHRLRAESDAVLVGVRTVLKDDPRLTVRTRIEGAGERPRPVKIILDTFLRTPPSARLFKGSGTRVWIATTPRMVRRLPRRYPPGTEFIAVPEKKAGDLDLKVLLRELGRRGIVRLLVEGGGRVNASFLLGRLAQEVYFFTSPRLLGGSGAVSSCEAQGMPPSGALRLKRWTLETVGRDFLVHGWL